jgi:hypothetical protein
VFYGIKNKGTPQHHKNNTGLLIVKDIVCPGDIPKGMQHRLLQRHLHTHIYCSAFHNNQVMEIAKMPHY